MTSAAPPQSRPAPPPPPPRSQNSTPPTTPAAKTNGKFEITTGVKKGAQRIGIYGPGGIGKSSLAAMLTEVGRTPLILDVEDGSRHIDTARMGGLRTWDDLRAAINSPDLWTDYQVVVIDSLTKVQDMAVEGVCREGNCGSLEEFQGGYGKGYRRLYDYMVLFMADLDRHIEKGRDVVVIMHEHTTKAPNPFGEDLLRYEPNLYASEKVSVKNRVKEWLDHLLFIGYDIHVDKDGKGKGHGSRTIFPREMPTHWAKSRVLASPIAYAEGDALVWRELFQGGAS